MKLEPLMTMEAKLKPAVDVGPTPYGRRMIFEGVSGSFEGPRLRGEMVSGGGDWILIDSEGVGHLDVRLTMQTDDDARIYTQYYGVLVMNDKVTAALAGGGEIAFGDTYFMTQPRFETGDPRYTWLNRLVAVAEGRMMTNAVEYRVFECVNG